MCFQNQIDNHLFETEDKIGSDKTLRVHQETHNSTNQSYTENEKCENLLELFCHITDPAQVPFYG